MWEMARKYNKENRLKQAEQTRKQILIATENLLRTMPLTEVSLNVIAREANTTVQTILRHFGSREGCLNALVDVVFRRVSQQRKLPPTGSVEECVEILLTHYEGEGRLVLNLLAQEQSGNGFIGEVLKTGRSFHREWVRKCFSNHLPDGPAEELVDELVVLTDVYVWKLLRLDLKKSRRQTKQTLVNMITKLLEEA